MKAPSQNTIVSIRHTETVSHAKISSGFAVSSLYGVQGRFQSPQSTNTGYKEKKLRVCSGPDHQPRGAQAGCPCEGLRDESLTADGAGCELQGSHSAPTA